MTIDEECRAAADFIARWEGYSSRAYWDVNAYRTGYGSDTEGPDEIPVTQHTLTTQPRALANLAKRVPAFRAVCVRAVTPATWATLNVNQRVALIDICYNYGHVPFQVTTDAQHVAAQFQARAKDNRGVNAKRRQGEATLYVTAPSTPRSNDRPEPLPSIAATPATNDAPVPAVLPDYIFPLPYNAAPPKGSQPMTENAVQVTLDAVTKDLPQILDVLNKVLPTVVTAAHSKSTSEAIDNGADVLTAVITALGVTLPPGVAAVLPMLRTAAPVIEAIVAHLQNSLDEGVKSGALVHDGRGGYVPATNSHVDANGNFVK